MNTELKSRQQLLEKITQIEQEINHKKDRLNYNIFAEINKKALLAQRKEIFYLELQL